MSGNSVRLLLDTQILVWMVNLDRRFRSEWFDAMFDPGAELFVSVVVAFEYVDLQRRARLPIDEPFAELVEKFELEVVDLPSDCWRLASDLPPIHRDPIDRMLVAHAMSAKMALVSADENIRRYPVECI